MTKLWDALAATAVMIILPVILAGMTARYVSMICASDAAEELRRAVLLKHEITEDMVNDTMGRLPGLPGGYTLEFEARRAVYEPQEVFYELITDQEIWHCMDVNGSFRVDDGDIFRVRIVYGGASG